MFARRRKKPPPAQVTGCEGSGVDLAEPGPERERHRLLQTWRRSEQRVTRTWQAWLAATAEDQCERYRAYLGALAEEEAAAMAVQSASRPEPTPPREATADVAEPPPR
jgi:hypothetical protein